MLDHVTLRTADRDASQRFYDTVLAQLGIRATGDDGEYLQYQSFSLASARDGRPPTRGLHVGFVAPSREHVDAFWRAGTQAGYADDGAPGERPQYSADYYGAFLLDPDGNSAEAVHHAGRAQRGVVDHLWIRVADVAAARDFYAAIAPHAGLRAGADTPQRAQFRMSHGSFSLVRDERPRTERVHLAFGARAQASVDAFHAAALAAGHRDDGAPGLRPEYGDGYYGAFVLDPDGHSVEVVHRRPA